MELQFKINPDYIFLHAINQSQPNVPFKKWEDFTNRIWEGSKGIFYFLGGYAEYQLYLGKEKNIEKTAKKVEIIFNQLRKSKEFQRLVTETEKYKLFIEEQWQENKENVLKLIEELSGLKSPDKTIRVYLTHPKLKNGRAVDNQTIAWGHSEDWKNYSTVYLAHELMHIVTFKKTKNFKVMHALIELMTDNELRIRLNKKGRYFKEGKFNVGHPYLRNLEKRILPYWKEYLKNKKEKNLFDLEGKIIKVSSNWKIK